MLVYPQLTSGALSQFPATRRRTFKTIVNEAADGSAVKLIDVGGGKVEWQLSYSGLSDTEMAALQQFFLSTEGSLNGFTFLDPGANLLAWSEVLTDSAWNAEPALTLSGGIPDAIGGSNGWHITNSGGGPQALSQTLNAPGGYRYCFSVFVRSAQPGSVTLTAGNISAPFVVGTNWSRIATCESGDLNGTSVTLGIVLPAGAAIDVFGPQAEVQGTPSAYQTATEGGIYPNARFREDCLSFTTLAPNCHSATVTIIYANHL